MRKFVIRRLLLLLVTPRRLDGGGLCGLPCGAGRPGSPRSGTGGQSGADRARPEGIRPGSVVASAVRLVPEGALPGEPWAIHPDAPRSPRRYPCVPAGDPGAGVLHHGPRRRTGHPVRHPGGDVPGHLGRPLSAAGLHRRRGGADVLARPHAPVAPLAEVRSGSFRRTDRADHVSTGGDSPGSSSWIPRSRGTGRSSAVP